MKFSLQTILALVVVAALIAAIYSERRKTTELNEGIASTKEWLDSFNHYSIEALPYYQNALAWEDPTLPFAEKLVAQVEEQQKLIESMPDRHASEVSVVEIATMDPFCYTYAIHVPEHKTAKVDFFIAKKRNDSLEDHFEDHEAPYLYPWAIDLPEGLSKLEVVYSAIDETPQPAKPGAIVFAKFTPVLEIRLNGKSIFHETVPGYSNVGSNHGWKPDAKQQLVLGKSELFHEFATYYYAQVDSGPMTGAMPRRGKSFRIKFRVTAADSTESETADE